MTRPEFNQALSDLVNPPSKDYKNNALATPDAFRLLAILLDCAEETEADDLKLVDKLEQEYLDGQHWGNLTTETRIKKATEMMAQPGYFGPNTEKKLRRKLYTAAREGAFLTWTYGTGDNALRKAAREITAKSQKQ